MSYRSQFINSIPNVGVHRKQQVISHMDNMRTRSLIFRTVEILEPCLIENTPIHVKQMAAGFSALLHQYYVFDWEHDDLMHRAFEVAQKYYAADHAIWDIYKNQNQFWSVGTVGKWYQYMDTDDFKAFEDFGLKHRSYTFVLYETLKPYMYPDIVQTVHQSLIALMNGFSYFYDVVIYFEQGFETYDVQLAKFSERRAIRVMQDAGYALQDIDCDTLQKYVLATGEYEVFLQKARAYYQQSYDGFASIPSSGGRIRVIRGLIRYCDTLLREAQDMFAEAG